MKTLSSSPRTPHLAGDGQLGAEQVLHLHGSVGIEVVDCFERNAASENPTSRVSRNYFGGIDNVGALTDELVVEQSDVREGPKVAEILWDWACEQGEPTIENVNGRDGCPNR